ncbi:MAG: TIGR02757 family protein [Oligoflexia bacterium]|nr:TIGR02757 family protein [Oligoflexia bacterium]
MTRIDLLRHRLLEVENSFDFSGEIKNDPLALVLRFSDSNDREVAALIAAVFAYGNVRQIQNSLEKIFLLLGPQPSKKLKTTTGKQWKKLIPQSFKHRFNTADDLGLLLTWLGHALKNHGSLENLFKVSSKNLDIAVRLENFINALTSQPSAPYIKPKSRGALFFFPKPSGKSACKRLLLFLRWVCGTGPMDLSLWKSVNLADLIIPVDTHVLRISKHLGFTKRKDNSWQTAVEITEALKQLDALNPTRFDFALCHLGISQECPSRFNVQICGHCRMKEHCLTFGKATKKLETRAIKHYNKTSR